MSRPARKSTTPKRATGGREKILQATIDLVCERGFSATSVNQVCQRAGIAKTALYWHFGDRDGLMKAVIDDITLGFISEIRDSVFLTGPPQDRKDRMVAGIRDIVENRPQRFRTIILAVLERKDPDPYFRDACWRVTQNAIQAIADGYRATLGIDLPDMDLFGHTVVALMVEALRTKLMNPEGCDMDRFFQEFNSLTDLMIRDRIRRFNKENEQTETGAQES